MPGDDLRIVPAPRALKPRIEELTRATFQEHRARQPFAFPENLFDVMVQPNIDAAFRGEMGELEESSNLFAAFRGDDLAGYVLLSKWAEDDANPMPYVDIDDICVVPEHRNFGVGHALLQFVRDMADERDWDGVNASVWAGNEASEALFQSAGFRPEMTRYRYGPDRSARNFPVQVESQRDGNPSAFWIVAVLAAVVLGALLIQFG